MTDKDFTIIQREHGMTVAIATVKSDARKEMARELLDEIKYNDGDWDDADVLGSLMVSLSRIEDNG